MASQILNLTRNDFEQCVTQSFKDLYNENNFLDVTLVSEDGKEIQAHKAVLGSCSSVLKNILVRNPHQHPLIFITGVSNDHLKSMIKFMYLGQTEIAEENLESLLKFASHFQVKGLIEEHLVEPVLKTEPSDEKESDTNKDVMLNIGNEFVEATYNFDMDNLAKKGDITEEKVNCDFKCENCDYNTTQKGHLKRHMKAKHEGVKFNCNLCDYQTGYPSNLKVHKQNKHIVA